MDIINYWQAISMQKADEIAKYFHPNASIFWHNTNERFTVNEFIVANCEYPDEWQCKVERVESKDNLLITVVRVYNMSGNLSFHAVSFFTVKEQKIIELHEYWGQDDMPPQWRLDKKLGSKITD